ncbi:hypothetical protein [Salinispora mooreana]|uniref:hypothetical protein n=1 Tax=Salinispora mooreana TaxID=999545 RepID=UPI00039E64ED|nr:hypothetical protein [Salinispora mooreana]
MSGLSRRRRSVIAFAVMAALGSLFAWDSGAQLADFIWTASAVEAGVPGTR